MMSSIRLHCESFLNHFRRHNIYESFASYRFLPLLMMMVAQNQIWMSAKWCLGCHCHRAVLLACAVAENFRIIFPLAPRCACMTFIIGCMAGKRSRLWSPGPALGTVNPKTQTPQNCIHISLTNWWWIFLRIRKLTIKCDIILFGPHTIHSNDWWRLCQPVYSLDERENKANGKRYAFVCAQTAESAP